MTPQQKLELTLETWSGGSRGCIKTGGWFIIPSGSFYEYFYGDLYYADGVVVLRASAARDEPPPVLIGSLPRPVLEFIDSCRTMIFTDLSRVELFSFDGAKTNA